MARDHQFMQVLADIGALVATVLAVVGTLPQLRRLASTSDTAGLPLSAATLSLASQLGWLAYSSNAGLWSAVPAAAALAGLDVAVAWLLIRCGATAARAVTVGLLWGAALAAGTVVGGWGVLGSMLIIDYALRSTPSVWSAYRTEAPSGVSLTSWVSRLVESLLWGVYGGVHRDPVISAYAAIELIASVLIIIRLGLAADRIRYARAAASPGPWSALELLGRHLEPSSDGGPGLPAPAYPSRITGGGAR